MRRFFPAVAIAILFTGLGATTADAQGWFFGGGFHSLHMGDTDDAILIIDDSDNELCNASDLTFDMESGFELTAQYVTNSGILDFRFICVGGFSAEKSLSSTNGAHLNLESGPVGEGPAPADVDAVYESEFYCGELNWITPHTNSIDFLIGIRAFQINDDFEAMIDGGAADGHFINSVDNRLLGIQTGTNLLLVTHGDYFSIDASVKTGAYLNNATHFSYYNGTGIYKGTTKTTKLAVGAEIGIFATLQVTQNLAIRGGYELFLFSGVGSSTDQIPGTIAGSNPGFTTGDTYLQGGNLVLVYGG